MRCSCCQQESPEAARFCMHCGAPATARPTPRPDPHDYTPRHLAEKILQIRSALEGERKQVTVLFADVARSVELSAQLDPEEWRRVLDRFFRILADGVHRFEGTINQYTGDGIMALFGAPVAHEDHAQRACYSALHLSARLHRYAQALKRDRGISLSVRMGLNSGEVIVGRIGDDLRMDYTAQGHTVGLAFRMQELASPDTVYLTEHTAARVEGFFELEDLGRFRVRGAPEPVRVRQLRGVGRLRTRLDLARARGLSRFVGRDAEMGLLEDSLERAVKGEGQVLGVVADPGIGKSRLTFELTERCRSRGVAVRETHGVSHGRMIPFLPVQQLMRGYFGIAEDDDDETARDKIAGRVVRLDPELSEDLPLLFGFFGVPDPRSPAPVISAVAREKQLFSIIRRLVHARSAREPAVIVVEDLHWIDGASERFVQNLAQSIPGTCTLLILNYRPEYAAEWLAEAGHAELPLRPLGAAAIDQLVEDLLGPHPSLAGLGRRLAERAQGNPLFAEELVQGLVESGHLSGSRGAYELARPIDTLAMAPTLQALLASRIDRLPDREKHVLHAGAVIGKTFAESVLERVAGLPEGEVAEALRRLVDATFLVEDSLYPERELAFRHPLSHEVAYSTQLAEHRQRQHAAVAEAIETVHAGKLDERAALLAHHWEGASDALRASRWHRRAALFAGAHHFAEAARHWYRVRELLDAVPESAETIAMGVEARGQLIVAAGRLGEAADTVDAVFGEAEALARRSDDPAVGLRTLLHYGYYKSISGELDAAQRLFDEARGRVGESDDADLEAAALYLPIASRITGAGQCAGSLPLIEEALAFTASDPERGREVLGFPPQPVLRVFRSTVEGMGGRLPVALQEVRQVARDDELHAACQLMGLFFSVLLAEMAGEAAGALDDARRLMDLADSMGFGEGYARVSLGRALLLESTWKQAEEVFRHGLEDVRTRRTYLHLVPGFLVGLSRAQLAGGDVAGALAVAREAVSWTEGRGLYGADAQLALARALLARGNAPDEAAAAVERARGLLRETGVVAREPALHEVGGEHAWAVGREAEAEDAWREALRLYREVGAWGHVRRLGARAPIG